MRYANAAWKQERESWRAVIQLNLIRSAITILETLQAELDSDPITTPEMLGMSTEDLLRPSIDTTEFQLEPTETPLDDLLMNKHHVLQLRLSPLRRVEADLKRRLGAGTEEVTGGTRTGLLTENTLSLNRRKEFGVRAWKDALGSLMESGSTAGRHNGEKHRDPQPPDEATEVIASRREDIKAMWMDKTVRGVLVKRRMRMEDSAGLLVCRSLLLWVFCRCMMRPYVLQLPR